MVTRLHATRSAAAAGAGSAVIAVAAHSDWPPAARALPRVADAGTLELESIVALQPDLVVAWPYTASAQLAALRAQRLPVFFSNPRTIDGIASDIEKLGTLAGTHDVAAAAASALRQRHATLKARPRTGPPLRVFYEIWNQPLYTIGGRHLISEAIQTCGGVNVFASLTVPAPAVSLEAVIASAPDVIVGGDDAGGRPPWLADWQAWPGIPAVRDGNVFAVDGNLLHRPGPRFVEGVAALCEELDKARQKRRR